MKKTKLLVLLFLCISIQVVKSQVANYVFTQTSSPAYSTITEGTVHTTGTTNDYEYTNVPMGITFNFNGVDYTTCNISTNGFISFGSLAGTTNYSPISSSASYGIISAFGSDLILIGGSGGTLRSQLVDSTFIVQWSTFRRFIGGFIYPDNLNFQIRLTSGTNEIRIVYGTNTINNTTSLTCQVGLRGFLIYDFNNRATTTNWTTSTAGTSFLASCTNSNTITPPSGRNFIWTPPSRPINDNCSSPYLITPNTTCVNTTGTTINSTQQFLATCDDGTTGGGLIGREVWYMFSADGTSTYSISVTGTSAFDPVLQLDSGDCGNPISINCVNTTGSGGTETINSGLLALGSYIYRVFGSNATVGDFNTCVIATARPCDSCIPDVSLGAIDTTIYGYEISGNAGNAGKWVASFSGVAGYVYHFDLCPDTPGTGTANYNIDIKILNASCNIVSGENGSCLIADISRPNDFQWTCPSNGNYFVTLAPFSSFTTNNCTGVSGNTHTMNYYAVPPCPYPQTPGIITGPNSVCVGQENISYSIPVIINASGYNWTLPQGLTITSGANTNSISLSVELNAFSGNITTQGTNYCSSGPISESYPVIINSNIPDNPGQIQGFSEVCAGQTQVNYFVPEINNAVDYYWVLPVGVTLSGSANTNSITVNVASNATSNSISVLGANGCGIGGVSQDFPITINPLPGVAGIISGPTEVCAGQSGVIYSVPPIDNATSYDWIIPSGANIISGNNTNSITIDFAGISGNINVKGINSCGEGVISQALGVMVIPLPVVPEITAQGATSFCTGDSVLLISNYSTGNHWSNGGINTSIIINSTGIYYLNVEIDGCSSISDSISVLVYEPETPTLYLQGNTLVTTQGLSYFWFLNNNYISGANSQSFTPTQNGVYFVIVEDTNGCTATSDTINFNSLGVFENNKNDLISVYPNPTSGLIYLKLNTNVFQKYDVILTDIFGKEVFRKKIENAEAIVDITKYDQGIYFLRIFADRNVSTNVFRIEKN